MKHWILIAAIGLVSLSVQAQAQDQQERERREVLVEVEEQRADLIEEQERLREAKMRLAEAAEEVARLSGSIAREGLPRVETSSIFVRRESRPRLGIMLETREKDGKPSMDGVKVMRVMPGSPALDAGIAIGDTLISVEGESLRNLSASEAVERIGGVLEDRDPGDEVTLVLLRDGDEVSSTLTLTEGIPTGLVESPSFAFFSDEDSPATVIVEEGQVFPGQNSFEFLTGGPGEHVWLSRLDSAFGDMELVELTPGLGAYFGVDAGLLVVRAPSDDSLGFMDGDVIREIGGREPSDVGHAMRILRSYDSGESLDIEITRQKRKRTLSVELPETKTGMRIERLRR